MLGRWGIMMECTPNKEALLALIQPDMKLTKEFMKRTYSFELDYPGFSEEAIAALEKVGCIRAREHYTAWVKEHKAAYEVEMKEVAHWYRLECERQCEKMRKEGEERRKKAYLASSPQSSSLQQQKEKLAELKMRIQALS